MDSEHFRAFMAKQPQPEPSPGDDDTPHQGTPPTLPASAAAALARRYGVPAPIAIGHNLWATTALVTPLMAWNWLRAFNTHNRPFYPGNATKIANDIAAEMWYLHHQGIGIRADGQLQDAQHRLYAIYQSGIAVPMMLVFNVTDQARRAIDIHKPRRALDIAVLDGLPISQKTLSVVRRILLGFHSHSSREVSNQHGVAEALKWRPIIEWVHSYMPGRRSGLSLAVVSAALCRAFLYAPSTDVLATFCTLLATGLRQDGTALPSDQPVIYLRDWLLGSSTALPDDGTKVSKTKYRSRAEATTTRIYGKVLRGIQIYFKGDIVKSWPSLTREIYPLPDAAKLEAACERAYLTMRIARPPALEAAEGDELEVDLGDAPEVEPADAPEDVTPPRKAKRRASPNPDDLWG